MKYAKKIIGWAILICLTVAFSLGWSKLDIQQLIAFAQTLAITLFLLVLGLIGIHLIQ